MEVRRRARGKYMIHMYIQRELRKTVLFSWSNRFLFLNSLITCKSRDKNVIRRPTEQHALHFQLYKH